MKKTFRLLSFFFIIIFVIACSGNPSNHQTITEQSYLTSTVENINSTFTPLPLPNEADRLLTQTSTPIANPTFDPTLFRPFSIDNFRFVYEVDGNIYVRDGLNPAKKITSSGIDRDPLLSDDGQKIVFYRGEANDNVYSINADGSNELLIIQSKSFPILSQGEIKALTFVPKTHLLLFNTYLCNERPNVPLYDAMKCVTSIYKVDTDLGERYTIVEGLMGNEAHERNFEISPDGQYITVASAGHVDIFSIEGYRGMVYHPDAITYYRTRPTEYLPRQYWLPDSSGFISIISTSKSYDPTTPPHTYAIFRFSLADKKSVEISLEEPIDGRHFNYQDGLSWAVSPDRNWIYFSGSTSPFVYVGNLNDGSTQIYKEELPSYFQTKWSPDSKYLTYTNSPNATINSLDESISMSVGGVFIEWLDPTHYVFIADEGNTYNKYLGEVGGESILLPEDFPYSFKFAELTP